MVTLVSESAEASNTSIVKWTVSPGLTTPSPATSPVSSADLSTISTVEGTTAEPRSSAGVPGLAVAGSWPHEAVMRVPSVVKIAAPVMSLSPPS